MAALGPSTRSDSPLHSSVKGPLGAPNGWDAGTEGVGEIPHSSRVTPHISVPQGRLGSPQSGLWSQPRAAAPSSLPPNLRPCAHATASISPSSLHAPGHTPGLSCPSSSMSFSGSFRAGNVSYCVCVVPNRPGLLSQLRTGYPPAHQGGCAQLGAGHSETPAIKLYR